MTLTPINMAFHHRNTIFLWNTWHLLPEIPGFAPGRWHFHVKIRHGSGALHVDLPLAQLSLLWLFLSSQANPCILLIYKLPSSGNKSWTYSSCATQGRATLVQNGKQQIFWKSSYLYSAGGNSCRDCANCIGRTGYQSRWNKLRAACIQGQAGCGSMQPGLMVGDPAHGRGIETRWPLRSFSTQAILCFCDSKATNQQCRQRTGPCSWTALLVNL